MAGTTPPADVTWLSLIMTMSNKPILWFLPPPMSTAHLSGSLNPGAVFLVSKMQAEVPCQVCMLSRLDATNMLCLRAVILSTVWPLSLGWQAATTHLPGTGRLCQRQQQVVLGGGEYVVCIAAPHIRQCDITSNDKTHVDQNADGLRSSPEAAKRPLDATLLCHTDTYGGFLHK